MKNSKMLLILSIFIFMCSLILSACDKPERQTTPIAYQIEFYSDNNLYHTIETAGNNKLNLPIKPTKNGLHFNGWFFDGG